MAHQFSNTEVWRKVAEAPHIIVSNRGRVRNTRTGRLLGSPDSCGYLQVSLRPDGSPKQVVRKVHHLVLEAFVGPRPSLDHQTRHLDDDPSNNRIENLAWGTKWENSLDKQKDGHGKRLFSDAQVREIRQRVADGESVYSVARAFGVSDGCMWPIVDGRTYRNSGGPISKTPPSGYSNWVPSNARSTDRLTDDEVREIRKLASEGAKQKDLALQFGRGLTSINHLIHRRTYAHVE